MTQENLILGAGISGLYVGLKLSEENEKVHVVEKTSTVGGMAKSLEHEGFKLDFGPHKIYSIIPGVLKEYQRIMDDKLIIVEKSNSIFLEGKRIQFPLNILKAPFQINPITAARCGLSFLWTQIKNSNSKKEVKSYEEYFLKHFGKAGYDTLFRDLGWKVWGDPKILAEEIGRKRVPVKNISSLVTSMLKKSKPEMSAAKFLYPPQDGFGFICETLKEKIVKKGGAVEVETVPQKIKYEKKEGKSYITEVTVKRKGDEEKIANPKRVISTIHISDLLTIMEPRPPEEIFASVKELKFRALVLVFVFIDQETILGENWTFFPERKYIFNRVSEPKLSSPSVAPKGKTYLITEVTLDQKDSRYENEEQVVKEVIDGLLRARILKNKKQVAGTLVKKARRIYPVYDIHYKKHLNRVLDWCDSIENLFLIGRSGLFNYNNTDHCIDAGMKLVHAFQQKDEKKAWKQSRETFEEYTIVD